VLATMTGSKYGKQYSVPKEFPSVLKAFTREVLRSQPADIYEFGSQYFAEMLAQEEAAAAAELAGPRRLSPEELRELLDTMFHEADVDSSGALSMTEFKEVLKMADLGLSDRETKRVMAEADFDDNGEISYDEFIPLAVDLVGGMYAKMDAEADREQNEADAREEAQNYLMHGMTKEEVEQVMGEIFAKSDVDGSGNLSISEFRKCCKDADIGLTKKEINVLMHQCDVDGDGHISYEEFVPLCFEMLTEILKDELLKEKQSPSELEEFLKDVWSEADTEQQGALGPLVLQQTLRQCELGLTRLQIHSILADAEYDEDGMANYMKFAPKAADLIYRLLDPDAQLERRKAIEAMSDADIVHGFNQYDLQSTLEQEFAAYDTAGSGILPMATIQTALASSSLGLSPQEVNSLMSAAECDPEGLVYHVELSKYAFFILQYLAQNSYY